MSPTNPVQKVNSTGLLQSGSYASDLENEYVDPPGSPEIWSEALQSQSILFDQWYSIIILVPEISRKVKILAWNGFAQFSPQLQHLQRHQENTTRTLDVCPSYTQLPKSWRNPKNLEISLGEGFCGSRGDVAFSLCLG